MSAVFTDSLSTQHNTRIIIMLDRTRHANCSFDVEHIIPSIHREATFAHILIAEDDDDRRNSTVNRIVSAQCVFVVYDGPGGPRSFGKTPVYDMNKHLAYTHE